MKILIIHNLYQQPGGEDVVARQECELLRQNGHDARILIRSNRSIEGKGRMFGALSVFKGIWWPGSVKDVLAEIQSFKPDVVHIHNLWYQFNPSLISGIKSMGIPVVMTLHNFRLICANAVLMRNGVPCRKCVGSTGLWGVYYKCYRGSYFLSLCSYLMGRFAKAMGVWRMDVDRFICLTGFSRDIFVKAGFPEEKLTIKPNFLPLVESHEGEAAKTAEPSAVYLGRLSPDKGGPFLLKAWERRKEKLYIGGTGSNLRSPANVVFMGHLPRPEAMALLKRSWVLVVPAIAYETFGLVIIEAFRAGTPVLASSNGTFNTIIENGRTGILFNPGDEVDFHAKLDLLFGSEKLRTVLAAHAEREFREKYSEEVAYAGLERLYAELAK